MHTLCLQHCFPFFLAGGERERTVFPLARSSSASATTAHFAMFPIALCDLNLTGELEKMCQYMCDYLYKKMYIYIFKKKKDSLVCPNEIWWVMWTTEISQQKELLVIIGSF